MESDSDDARSSDLRIVESEREEEVSELDPGELADLRERADDGDEEAVAALREAGTMLVPQPLSAHLLASSSALESSRVCSPPSRVCTRAALQPVFLRMNVLLL